MRDDDFVDAAVAAGVRDERVLHALGAVPRRLFVPADSSARAVRRDAPVPLPEGQTTSQPSLIALMVEALALTGDERVLEVGTGYGFEAAVLSRVAREVWTVEWWPDLAATAAANLARFGADNVHVVVGDGRVGLVDHAPYGAVVVAAQAAEVPVPLIEQLEVGGRLVAPLGHPGAERCQVLSKDTSGDLVLVRDLGPVRFVPLIGS